MQRISRPTNNAQGDFQSNQAQPGAKQKPGHQSRRHQLHRVPPSPEVMAQLYSNYSSLPARLGLSFKQYLASIGYTNPAEHLVGMDDAASFALSGDGLELISVPQQAIEGSLSVKVLLVDFPDRAGSLPVSHYERLLFSKQSMPTGSMRDYFHEVSLGKVDVTGSVHGWLRMPHEYSYYANGNSGTEWRDYPRNAPRMAEDAVHAARASGVDFGADLDVLNDGTVTALFIIHAGLGAETLSPGIRGNHIWSHKWAMRNPIEVAPGLYTSTYLTVPNDAKLGVCAHELGHLAFQWEDFYDPNYDEDGKEWDGSGSWDLMASGSYNGNSTRPAHPAGLHKMQHNWIEVQEPAASGSFSLKPYTASHGSIIKLNSPAFRDGQYLLLENRARTGFDSHLPGEGLLVWKVDEKAEMFTPDHPALLLVQADGRKQLQTADDWNTGDAGDPFPGSSERTELGERGLISTSFDGGEDSGIVLSNIRRDPASGEVFLDISLGGQPLSETQVLQFDTQVNKTIPDNNSAGVDSALQVDTRGFIRQISVSVDIAHSYIGDLSLELISPAGQMITLHDREGDNANDIRRTYSSSASNGNTTALAALLGTQAEGQWRLRVSDQAAADVGTFERWSLNMEVDKGDTVLREQLSPALEIPDNNAAGIASAIQVGRSGVCRRLKLNLDISHTYRGDLRVELLSPQGRRVLIHNQSGGGQDDLKVELDSSRDAELAELIGAQIRGQWVLRVADLVGQDTGVLNSWSLEIDMAPQTAMLRKSNDQQLSIPDNDATGVGSAIGFTETGSVQSLELQVEIQHSYTGDLRVELIAPSGNRALLHDRSGGRTRNLNLSLKSNDFSALQQLLGEPVKGDWVLRVTDLEGLDTGKLLGWSIGISYTE